MDPEVVIQVVLCVLHGFIIVLALHLKRISRIFRIIQKFLTVLIEIENVFNEIRPARISYLLSVSLSEWAKKAEQLSKFIWISLLIVRFLEERMSYREKNVEINQVYLLGQWIR